MACLTRSLYAMLAAVTLLAASAFAQSGGLVNATRGYPQPNDGTTGTTLNGTAKAQANGTIINAGTGDTTVPTYIIIGGAGTSGQAVIAAQGTLAPCTMDSTIASNAGGFYVVNSTSVAHDCHAQSAAPAPGTWIIGYMHDQATATGVTALVAVNNFVLGNGNATLKTCMILVGADNGAVLVNADLGPQTNQCKIVQAATIQEITLSVDNASSTTSVQVDKRHCATFTSGSCTAFTVTNLLSTALPAAATAKADACAKSTISATCIDGTTSSGTITVSATAISAGDWLELASGTADGTTKRATISITYTVP